ncbi:MAG: DNA polymerase III subunit delta [Proteobacteria bacterium]|nr:DNA polymerase III subunit delta [Pseudomonadota bacterium]
MIVKPADAERTVAHPPKDILAFLFFGPDEGLIRERAERAAKSVVPDLSDAFRVADLDDSVLSGDPARLADEAAAISMLGGRRVVRVRGAGNTLSKTFEAFFDNPKGDALIVVEAGDLAKSASLRRVFEEADNAAAIACYPDNDRDLATVVRDTLKAEGLTISAEALDDAVARLGSDRGVTRREIEKLALYAKDKGKVALEDVRAVMGDEAEARVDEVCDAAGEGNIALLDTALERLWSEDMSPIAILRIAMGHFQRLALAKVEAERGEGIETAMRRLRPPVHFMRATSFKTQARNWSEARLGEALDLLLEAEVLCKTTGVPAEAVCGRTFFNVAAMARRRE